jgi:hypothetical protein
MAEVTCTKDRPWDRISGRNTGDRIVHPDAQELRQNDGYPCGDTVDYECPHCGAQFTVELPQ